METLYKDLSFVERLDALRLQVGSMRRLQINNAASMYKTDYKRQKIFERDVDKSLSKIVDIIIKSGQLKIF